MIEMKKGVCMGNIAVALVCVAALIASEEASFAQAGSTGGTLGKTDKSASGEKSGTKRVKNRTPDYDIRATAKRLRRFRSAGTGFGLPNATTPARGLVRSNSLKPPTAQLAARQLVTTQADPCQGNLSPTN
jgi:hypothetical protein